MPGARAVLEDDEGRVLLVRRRDFDKWSLPAGSADEGESLLVCVQREVLEETGLEMIDFVPYGFASDPRWEVLTYPNGDRVHGFAILVYCLKWKGKLVGTNDENFEAKFFSLEALPSSAKMMPNELRSLEAYFEFKRTGQFQWS